MSNINEVFDIEPTDPATLVKVEEVVVPVVVDDNYEDVDFLAARVNYYELINQGKAAMNTAMMIAAETQNPRAVEVLSGLLKNMADVNKQLVQMSKDKQDVKAVRKNTGGANQQTPQIGQQTNNVFVGTSADLNKLLSDRLINKV